MYFSYLKRKFSLLEIGLNCWMILEMVEQCGGSSRIFLERGWIPSAGHVSYSTLQPNYLTSDPRQPSQHYFSRADELSPNETVVVQNSTTTRPPKAVTVLGGVEKEEELVAPLYEFNGKLDKIKQLFKLEKKELAKVLIFMAPFFWTIIATPLFLMTLAILLIPIPHAVIQVVDE